MRPHHFVAVLLVMSAGALKGVSRRAPLAWARRKLAFTEGDDGDDGDDYELEDDDLDDLPPLTPQGKKRGLIPRGRRTFGDYSLKDRLASVPVFYVAAERGNPYLYNSEDRATQWSIMFMDPVDCQKYLDEMEETPGRLDDARIMCVGCDKFLENIMKKPQKTGNKIKGKDMYLRYRLQGSEKEFLGYLRYKGIVRKEIDPVQNPFFTMWRKVDSERLMVPAFICNELTIKKGGVHRKPVFFSLDDFNAAWKTATKGAGDRQKPKLQIVNFMDLIVAASDPVPGDSSDFDNLFFCPLPRAVDYVRNARNRGNNKARLHVQVGQS